MDISSIYKHMKPLNYLVAQKIARQNKGWRKCIGSWNGWSSVSTMQSDRYSVSAKLWQGII